MGAALGGVLGHAAGVAISPIPIVAVILMSRTKRAAASSLSFLLGWVTGLAVVGVLAIGSEVGTSGGSESDSGAAIKVVIGVAFLFLAWRQWTARPDGSDEPEMPGWLASIDDVSVARSFGLAFLVSALNPKNLGLTIAAMATVAGSGLETREEVGVVAGFVLVASLTMATPVVLNFVLGDRVDGPLEVMGTWLGTNDNTVMATLFVVLGATVLGDGIALGA